DLRDLGDLSYLRDLRDLRDLSYLSYVRYLSYLSYLRDLLLTREVAERAKIALPGIEPVRQVNLLGIIMGRMLHIEEAEEMGDAVEREVQQLVNGIGTVLRTRPGDKVKEAALDAL